MRAQNDDRNAYFSRISDTDAPSSLFVPRIYRTFAPILDHVERFVSACNHAKTMLKGTLESINQMVGALAPEPWRLTERGFEHWVLTE